MGPQSTKISTGMVLQKLQIITADVVKNTRQAWVVMTVQVTPFSVQARASSGLL